MAVVRGTFGYHRDNFPCSVSAMQRMTGLSYNGVVGAARSLEKAGLIHRVLDGKKTATWHVVIEPSPSEDDNSQTPSASEGLDPQPVRVKPSASEGQLGLNKDKEIKEKRNNQQADYSQAHRLFLDTFGAKRFRTKVQYQVVQELENQYGIDKLSEAVTWAATRGMGLGAAIPAIQTALPKWGKPKPIAVSNRLMTKAERQQDIIRRAFPEVQDNG